MSTLFFRLWVLVLGLVLSVGLAQATTDWDEGFEYANNTAMAAVWSRSCGLGAGVLDVSTTQKHGGSKSMKETFNGVEPPNNTCIISRDLSAASDTVYTRVWIYLNNFTPNSTATKLWFLGKNSTYPNFWYSMISTTNINLGITNEGNGFTTYTQAGTDTVPQNQWTCIETQITMNTPGQANGIARTWKNGSATPGMNVTNGQWRGSTLNGFNGPNSNMAFTNFYVQHGSGVIYYDDYAVSRDARIGCGGTIPQGDTINPSPPTNPAASVSGTTETLTWTLGSDDVGGSGLANTTILHCEGAACAPTAFYASVTSPTASYTASGLTAGTIHGWAFKSIDNAGNQSATTTAIYATTGSGAVYRTILATDTFVRADAATLGANWTLAYTGGQRFQIISNYAAPGGVGGADTLDYYTAGTAPANDQWAQVTLQAYSSSNTYPHILVRWSTPASANGYACAALPSELRIRKMTAGVFSTLVTVGSNPFVTGDMMRCEAQGTALRFYRIHAGAETLVLSTTDATHASGRTGLDNSADVALIDTQFSNFVMGEFSAVAPTPPAIVTFNTDSTGFDETDTGSPTSYKLNYGSNDGLVFHTLTIASSSIVAGRYNITWPQGTQYACLYAIDSAGTVNTTSPQPICDAVTPGVIDSGPATGVLRQLGTTPWLTDASGNAILLSGISGGFDTTQASVAASFTFPNAAYVYLQDMGTFATPVTNDYQTAIANLVTNGQNFIRIWNEPTSSLGSQADYDADLDLSIPIGTVAVPGCQMPWKLVNTRVDTTTGHNRTVGVYDLAQFEPCYFDRLRTRILYAVNHGVHPSIMLFAADDPTTAFGAIGMPFYCPDASHCNNVNSVNVDTGANGIAAEFYSLAGGVAGANITAFQDAFARKVVDTLNDIDGYFYEVSNEVPSDWVNFPASFKNWVDHIADTITAYEATGGRKVHPVWISPFTDHLANMLTETHGSIIGVWCESVNYLTGPPVNTSGRVVIYDTDHSLTDPIAPYAFGCKPETADWPWRSFTRGVHIANFDGKQTDAGVRTAVKLAQKQTITYANRMGLKDMLPVTDTTIIGTGYGLKNDCVEYLSFKDSDGAHVIDLTGICTGKTFTVESLDIITGTVTAEASVSGNGSRSINPSGTNASVVYLKVTPAPADVTAPTIFGCTIDGLTTGGVLPIGTTSATLQCFTNESATMKFGDSAGVAYASQPTSMTAGTFDGVQQPHTATISGLTNGSSSTKYLRAIDSSSNASSSDTTMAWTVGGQADMTPPVMSYAFPTTSYPAGSGGGPIGFTVDGASTCKYDTTDTTYDLMANTMTSSFPTCSAVVSGLADDTTTTYYGRACDMAEPTPNCTTQSIIMSVTIAAAAGDVTPPGTVSGLTATISDLQVQLTWTAASGGDVAGYFVYQCLVSDCSDGELKQTLGNTTTTFLGLAYSTTYYWAVKAFDTSNNPSAALSNIATGTTAGPLDTVPPSDMSNLQVVGVPFRNSVVLTFDPGTDDRGVTSATIELSPAGCAAFVFVYSNLTLNAQIGNLSSNTTYCARGKHSDGTNTSANYSNVVVFTTAASGLSQPRNLLPFGVDRNAATRSAAGARNPRP